jgi:hypothetical protein
MPQMQDVPSAHVDQGKAGWRRMMPMGRLPVPLVEVFASHRRKFTDPFSSSMRERLQSR